MNRRVALVGALVSSLLMVSALSAEENVYKKALKSTVWVVQLDGKKIRSGSGSLIDAQKRLILTNYHVVRNVPEAKVFFPAFDKKGNLIPERETYFQLLRAGGGIPGKVLFTDSSKDLAVIQVSSVPRGTPALRLAKESPGPGDRIHSIGSPGVSGALFAYTDGSVKAVYHKRMKAQAKANDPDAFLIDAKIIETSSATNRGDSGGPLMNDKAELVGVTQGMLVGGDDVRPISFFVEVGEVRDLLKRHHIALSNLPSSTIASDSTKHERPAAAASSASTTTAASGRMRENSARAFLNGAALFADKPGKMKEIYQEVIEKYPGTKAAAEAKKLLEKLN
jgi:S1-C subfamily serine protease